MAQGEDVVPIPGTKRRAYLDDNAGAVNVTLTADELRRVDEVLPKGATAGLRYPQQAMAAVNR
jgi:aryl-alcohol dehydrogenase-like predicted oxidoreductase